MMKESIKQLRQTWKEMTTDVMNGIREAIENGNGTFDIDVNGEDTNWWLRVSGNMQLIAILDGDGYNSPVEMITEKLSKNMTLFEISYFDEENEVDYNLEGDDLKEFSEDFMCKLSDFIKYNL